MCLTVLLNQKIEFRGREMTERNLHHLPVTGEPTAAPSASIIIHASISAQNPRGWHEILGDRSEAKTEVPISYGSWFAVSGGNSGIPPSRQHAGDAACAGFLFASPAYFRPQKLLPVWRLLSNFYQSAKCAFMKTKQLGEDTHFNAILFGYCNP